MYYFYCRCSNGILIDFENDVKSMFLFILSEKRWGKEIDFKSSWNSKKINTRFKDFWSEYSKLSKDVKRKVIKSFFKNRKIEGICKGKIIPITYDDLNSSISNLLKDLDTFLYSDALTLSKLRLSKKEYYNGVITRSSNHYYICPFCGIEKIESEYSDIRDDFDHYLVRSKYPFASVNRYNLVPMCKKCNQNYKKTKDITDYTQVFFPFDMQIINYEINYDGNKVEINNAVYTTETSSWNEIFKVFDRSLRQIEQFGAVWFENDIQDIVKTYNQEIEAVLLSQAQKCKNNIFELRHLKSAYFTYLVEKGI
jgi:hypothetical protein